MRRVLLFVAMHSEAEPIARALSLRGSPSLRHGTVGDAEIQLLTPTLDAVTGVDSIGPVHAAAALASMLGFLTHASGVGRPDLVVNLGTAGGFQAQGLGIADLVLARDTMFHDARVPLPGYEAVARAHTRLSLDEAQLASLATRLNARVGLASTGSSLDATTDELAQFAAHQTLAKDMELAALAVVCRAHDLPLIALKGITDLVDHHEPTHEAFLRNLKHTSDRLAAVAAPFLEFVTH